MHSRTTPHGATDPKESYKTSKAKEKIKTMKMKRLFNIHLLMLAALCSMAVVLGSCSSEETVPDGTGTSGTDDKNLTTFVAAGPERTRTSMDYTGGDAPFYWEEGDKIYVKDDDGNWQASNAVDAAHAHSASFKFKVSGKFNNSSTYKVYYPGKNGTNNQVTIPATQTQTAPNTTLHFGDAGDCGMADATGTIGGGVFNFALDHQAAILVFQPYTSNEILKKCYLTKVEVISDDNITGTYTIAPSTGNLTGAGSSKQIETATVGTGTYVNGFPLTNATSSATADKVYMLIKPGVHTLRVRYWIKSTIDNIEGTVTKDLSSFDYQKNTYYDMTASLDVKNYEATYCCWDAQANFWYGHEWNAPNPADRWQPVFTINPYPHATELYNPTTPPRAANTSFPGAGIRNDAVNLCKDCPNANEMAWYTQNGDPIFDADKLWTCMGHLRKGGFWLKTKDRMARDHSTTVANIENAAPDGIDWRIETTSKQLNLTHTLFTTPPSASEMNDYLFLPNLGSCDAVLPSGGIFDIGGVAGAFWSSSAASGNGIAGNATGLSIYYTGSNIKTFITNSWHRTYCVFCPFKFE